MKFDFFTFGGSLFWEDVFFYQKWRIQRNCGTKNYRLLDPWDIRRASGSFEKCQKAFIRFIDTYEITKQQGHLVILLHGYMDGKNVFKRLWRKLILTKSVVAAVNYPSLYRNSTASAHQLLFFLNHIEDISEVSFITKGAGNLVLQQMLNLPVEQQAFHNKVRIRNILNINPVIEGSLLCDLLSRFKIFRLFCGPMISEMTEKEIKRIPELPKQYKSLKIFSNSKTYKLLLRLLQMCRFPVEESVYKKKDAVFVEGTTFRTLENQKILNYAVKYICNGKI